ncbi:hypothetical protein NF867_08845 [Solitalea sp. MAHUQ-68]|uniref:Uncharacterized protein n=1 Tax=Solitalea agri TaxID=2953739 RepID=A0A9X2F1I9_9SPHI|nr:hypothetical protein [Solitalea agri]MCO4292967.1 hypothetical protein [Solitalea agri]
MSRLTTEERQQRSLLNLQRLREQSRRDRAINFLYRKSKFFKVTVYVRCFFILFTVLNYLPFLPFKSTPEEVTGYSFSSSRTKYGGSSTTNYNYSTTEGNVYTTPIGGCVSINKGDHIIAYRNVFFKATAISKVDNSCFNYTSNIAMVKIFLTMLSILSILTFFKRGWLEEEEQLNAIMLAGLGLTIWYFFA